MEVAVHRITKGDKKEFQKLFELYFKAIASFAEKFIGSEAHAADIAQDAFIKYWQKRKNFFHINQVKSFLYTTARNACLNAIEHNKVVRNHFEREKLKSELYFNLSIIEEESYQLLFDAIEQLPDRTKEIIHLALEGKKNKEISDKLNISNETTRSHKKLAYKRLREILNPHYFALLCLFIK